MNFDIGFWSINWRRVVYQPQNIWNISSNALPLDLKIFSRSDCAGCIKHGKTWSSQRPSHRVFCYFLNFFSGIKQYHCITDDKGLQRKRINPRNTLNLPQKEMERQIAYNAHSLLNRFYDTFKSYLWHSHEPATLWVWSAVDSNLSINVLFDALTQSFSRRSASSSLYDPKWEAKP